MFCECGCGKLVKLKRGGELNRFVNGHTWKGKMLSETTRKNMVIGLEKRYALGGPSKETKRRISVSLEGNKNALGYVPTEESNRSRSRSLSGERHPNWQGGISNLPYPFGFNRKLRNQIKSRDGCRCQNPDCWGVTKKISVHHIDYDKNNCDPENLLVLCISCNSRANYRRGYWTETYYRIMGS